MNEVPEGCVELTYDVTHDKEYSEIVGMAELFNSGVDVLGMKSVVPQTGMLFKTSPKG